MAIKKRPRNVPLRVTDSELCQLHELANSSDQSISTMVRVWLKERWRAARGDASPPSFTTKGGTTIKPH